MNGKKPQLNDKSGNDILQRPMTPSRVASPINLLNPDRYEFYTFNDDGDLVKRLMTMKEIQSIVANGDSEQQMLAKIPNGNTETETNIRDIVKNVQNVLNKEIKEKANSTINFMHNKLDTPDTSSSWSSILPTIFGSTNDIKNKTDIKTKPNIQKLQTITQRPTTVVHRPSTSHKTTTLNQKQKPTKQATRVPSSTNKTKPGTIKNTNKQPLTTHLPNRFSSTPSKYSTSGGTKVVATNRPASHSTVTGLTRPASHSTAASSPRPIVIYTRPDLLTHSSFSSSSTTALKTKKPTATRPATNPIFKTKPTSFSSTQTEKPQRVTTKGDYIKITNKPNYINKITENVIKSSSVAAVTETIPVKKVNTKVYSSPPNRKQSPSSLSSIKTTESYTFRTPESSTKSATTFKTKKPTIFLSSAMPITFTRPQHTVTPAESRITVTSSKPTTKIQSTTPKILPTSTTTTTTSTEKEPIVDMDNIFDSELSLNQIIEALRDTETTTVNYMNSDEFPTTIINGFSAEPLTLISEHKETPNESIEIENIDGNSKNDFKNSLTDHVSYIPQTTIMNWPSSVMTTYSSNSIEISSESGIQHKETTDGNVMLEENKVNGNDNSMTNMLRESFDNVLNQVRGNDTSLDDNEIGTTTAYSLMQTEMPEGSMMKIASTGEMDDSIENHTKYFGSIIDKLNDDKKLMLTTTENFPTTTIMFNNDRITSVSDLFTTLSNALPDITTSSFINSDETNETDENTETSSIYSNDLDTTTIQLESKISNDDQSIYQTTDVNTEFPTTTTTITTSDDEFNFESTTNSDEMIQTEQSDLLRETNDLMSTTEIDSTTIETEAPTYQLIQLIENVPKKTASPITTTDLNDDSTIMYTTIATENRTNDIDVPVSTYRDESEFLNLGETTTEFHSQNHTSERLVKNSESTSRSPLNDLKEKIQQTIESKKSNKIQLDPAPKQALGLEESTLNANEDILEFAKLANEFAFNFWRAFNSEGISTARGLIVSPFAFISMLGMIFLGARGRTSTEINDLLHLDDIVTFNPHAIFKNITDSIESPDTPNISIGGFVRELFSDRDKGKILSFYKEKASQFYSGYVEEINFNAVNDIIRRRTNLLVKRHTSGRITDYLTTNNIWVKAPLVSISANIFETDCSLASINQRDSEMFFQVLPSVRHRRLVPIPAAVWKNGFTAGYDPELDATAVAIGLKENIVSTVFVMPGQQGHSAPGDSLERLESILMVGPLAKQVWKHLLGTLLERHGLEIQIPRFTHRSFINATNALKKLGLNTLFDKNMADLRGITGSTVRDLFISDLIQINTFSMCNKDGLPKEQQHIEMYPAPPNKYRQIELRNQLTDNDNEMHTTNMFDETQRAFSDPHFDLKYLNLPLPLRPRQARIPETPRLRFDKPFVYFVRHNPTGMILYMGRFNPRLLP